MMKHFAKIFYGMTSGNCIDQLNAYLEENPTHCVKAMTYAGVRSELMVYFEDEKVQDTKREYELMNKMVKTVPEQIKYPGISEESNKPVKKVCPKCGEIYGSLANFCACGEKLIEKY